MDNMDNMDNMDTIKAAHAKHLESVKRYTEKMKNKDIEAFKARKAELNKQSYLKKKAILDTLEKTTTRDKYISSGIVPCGLCVICGHIMAKDYSNKYITHKELVNSYGKKDIIHKPVDTIEKWKKKHPERKEATEDISIKVIKATIIKPVVIIDTLDKVLKERKKLLKALKK